MGSVAGTRPESALERFLPHPEVTERYATTVDAPATLVMETAVRTDLQALPLVRGIFRLRERLMRASRLPPRTPRGMLEELTDLGWGILADEPGRLIVGGAVCQPWNADVVFRAIPAADFAAFAEPGLVKIAWTLEAIPLTSERTRFATETRVAPTDESARARFRRYWRWARFGIVTIRLLLLPAVRKEAERQWRRRAPAAPAGA